MAQKPVSYMAALKKTEEAQIPDGESVPACIQCKHTVAQTQRSLKKAKQAKKALTVLCQVWGQYKSGQFPLYGFVCFCCYEEHCATCGQNAQNCECCPICHDEDGSGCFCCQQCQNTEGNCECCGECGDYPCTCENNECTCCCHGQCGDVSSRCPVHCDEAGAGRGRYGSSNEPPWEKRGVVIRNVKVTEKYDEIWDFKPTVDICRAVSDFYGLESLLQPFVTIPVLRDAPRTWAARDSHGWPYLNRLSVFSHRAGELFDELVERLDDQFRKYIQIAVAGELRHHRAIGGLVLHAESRSTAWAGWKQVYDAVGPEALKDAAALFREFSGSGFGGKPWAEIADVLYLREAEKLPPRIFVDRVFNLQHNGGICLNKVKWPVENELCWGLDQAETRLLPAHGEEITPWNTLLKTATPEVRELFARTWDTANEMRQWYRDFPGKAFRQNLPEISNPLTNIQFRTFCRFCYSDPARGHTKECYAPFDPNFNGGVINPAEKVDGPKFYMVVEEEDWGNWKWDVWKQDKYPIPPDGVMTLPAGNEVRVSITLDNNTGYGFTQPINAHMSLGKALETTVALAPHIKGTSKYAINIGIVRKYRYYLNVPLFGVSAKDAKEMTIDFGKLWAEHLPHITVAKAKV